jgi:hypothetical protein
MSSNWFEEFRKISEKMRLISQSAAFLISIFSFLSLCDLTRIYYAEFQSLKEFLEVAGLKSAILFQAAILLIFAARFVLLFFKTKRVFWLDRILWIIGLTLFISYFSISRVHEDLNYGLYSTRPEVFRHAPRSFDFLGMWFLVLSPIRQFLTLIIAVIKSFKALRRDAF